MNSTNEELQLAFQRWIEKRRFIREKALEWLKSSSFRDEFYDDVHPPLTVKVYLKHMHPKRMADRLWKNHHLTGIQRSQLWNAYQDLIPFGQVMFGQLIRMDQKASQDPHHHYACKVMVPLNQKIEALVGSFELSHFLKNFDPKQHHSPRLAHLLRDEPTILFQRRPLPVSENSDFTAEILDLQARESWLPPDHVPMIPILMNMGEDGAHVVIPWHLIEESPSEKAPFQLGRYAQFAEIDRSADAELARKKTSFMFQVWRVLKVGLIVLILVFIAIVVITYTVNLIFSLLNSVT